MTFRFARHTNDLEKLKTFYLRVLELEILGEFENHAGYDGVFIGKANENWHLEFTKSKEIIQFHFSAEDILVFYPNTKSEYEKILINIENHSIKSIEAQNPYWNQNGKMILDPDGYRIVICDLKAR